MNSFPYTLRIITSITYILYLFQIHSSIPSLLYGSYMNTKVKSNLSLAQLFIPIFLLPLQAPLSVAILPHISHFYNFEYTPHHKGHSSSATPALGRLAVFNRKGGVTGASSLADHSAFIYKRHFCRLLTWFVVFPEAFLAFAAQVSGTVQEAVDLMAVLADKYAALFFSGGSADGTLLFCSVGAQL